MERKANPKPGIAFSAFEAVPFIKTGGLGDVAGSFPAALQLNGCDVRVILPKLGTISEKYTSQMKHVADFTVKLGWRNQYCGLEELQFGGITWYFLDNEYYFKRDKAYGYFDDGERIAFFSMALVECLPHIPGFRCDILHLNDWHTALAPVFLREFYHGIPYYDRIRTVFTIHNLKFQGQYSDAVLGDILGLAGTPADSQLRFGEGAVNYMKGALLYSDTLTTVSPTYAEEIKTPFFGEGLENIFRERSGRLHGILNGIDTRLFSPESDPCLPARYSLDDPGGKAGCKAAIQAELGLEPRDDVPLLIMIGRLTEQKGLDLVARVLDEVMARRIQIAVLGTGDEQYETLFRGFGQRYKGRFSASIKFDAALSNRMYAGADLLLMPSLFEPCGLSQMIAMRYGTLPIVRETGGLKDSVKPYNQYTGEGTGFSFANFNAHEMMHCIFSALDLYENDRPAWNRLRANAMQESFGWDRAAKDYAAIYASLLAEKTKPERQTDKPNESVS